MRSWSFGFSPWVTRFGRCRKHATRAFRVARLLQKGASRLTKTSVLCQRPAHGRRTGGKKGALLTEKYPQLPAMPPHVQRETAERIVHGALIPGALGLALLYAIFAIGHLVALQAPVRVPMVLITVLTSAALVFVAGWVRKHPLVGRSHLVGAGIAAVVLANSSAHLWITNNPIQTTNFALLILGVGLFFLDLRWTVAIVVASFGTWVAITTQVQQGIFEYFLFTMLGACVLSTIICLIRGRVYGHLDSLRSDAETKASALSESERRYELALSGSNDGLYDWDLAKDHMQFSDRLSALLGFEPAMGVGRGIETFTDRIHPDDVDRVRLQLIAHLRGDDPFFEDEFRLRHQNDDFVWVLARGASIRDGSGRALRMAGSITDMSRRGVFDPLTGLPNRRLFLDRLTRVTLRRPEDTEPGDGYAVLFLDLDGFKLINDTLGHQSGDDLLKLVASRLQTCVRASDTVARLGGDEFVVLLDKVNVPEGVQITLNRITSKLSEPYDLGGRKLHIVPSIGVVIDTEHYSDPDELLRDADSAMYQAKESDEIVVVFDTEMREKLTKRLKLELELRTALDENQFLLHFQSIVSLTDGTIEGYEALARWQHPTRGLRHPIDFIEVMEETGLIVPLGHWVIGQACRDMMERFAGQRPLDMPYVSVNLSGKHLSQEDLVPSIEKALADTGFHPTRLRLELTESAIIDNPRRAASQLGQLKLLGVQILMDDFGTGHSSLSYLQNLPIDTLKIDRSFISRMTQDRDGAELVRTIIRMAQNLGLAVVAEGVETAEQVSLLQGMECGSGQGYLFARPQSLGSATQGAAEAEEGVLKAGARMAPAGIGSASFESGDSGSS